MPTLDPRHLGRYADIGRLLLKHRDDLLSPDDGEVATVEDANALADDLESMGPTFVKLGQLLSTRADLLPAVYLESLARLQDDVAPFSFAEVEEAVEEAVGTRISTAFSSFDHEPLACASLGQVHRAVLRSGRPVAVKVQRPGVREQCVKDMEAIKELAAFVDAHTRTGDQLHFAGMVEEFRRSLMAELDYRLEADNLRTLGSLLADYDRIVVPQPVDDYSTATVLTMDLVAGRNLSSLGPLGRMELEGGPLAEQLFSAYLEQILVHGFVHADPHPGNVLLTDDGDLSLVDLGMVVRVSRRLQDDLVRLLAAVAEGAADDAARALIDMGERTSDFDGDRYRREVERLVTAQQGTTLGDVRAGAIVGELARAAATSGLRPPVEMTMIGKALLNLDEVARILDPEADPNAIIRDRISDIMRRKLLADVSPSGVLSSTLGS